MTNRQAKAAHMAAAVKTRACASQLPGNKKFSLTINARNEATDRDLTRRHLSPEELNMKTFIAAVAILGLTASASFAQSGANPSAPQPGSTGAGVNQPGTTSTGTAVDRSDSMKKDGMSGTTGMKKDGMAKDGMSKDGMSKDGMKK
jgi:hypothetical protein